MLCWPLARAEPELFWLITEWDTTGHLLAGDCKVSQLFKKVGKNGVFFVSCPPYLSFVLKHIEIALYIYSEY